MSQYAAGINLDKACVLLALDRILDPSEWDREFIHDYFLEFGETGFAVEHFYLVAESAPIFILQRGSYQINYKQGDTYVRIIDKETLTRYRFSVNSKIIYFYRVGDSSSHAQAMFADSLLFYISKTDFAGLWIKSYDLIIDYVKELE